MSAVSVSYNDQRTTIFPQFVMASPSPWIGTRGVLLFVQYSYPKRGSIYSNYTNQQQYVALVRGCETVAVAVVTAQGTFRPANKHNFADWFQEGEVKDNYHHQRFDQCDCDVYSCALDTTCGCGDGLGDTIAACTAHFTDCLSTGTVGTFVVLWQEFHARTGCDDLPGLLHVLGLTAPSSEEMDAEFDRLAPLAPGPDWLDAEIDAESDRLATWPDWLDAKTMLAPRRVYVAGAPTQDPPSETSDEEQWEDPPSETSDGEE